ncbi:MAG TPA: YARHG domain-containing protein [Kofleriaceae bacterium]
MADAATKYEAECHAKWVFSSDDSCERYQYAINCIYAARGKVFVTPAWKDRFVSKPWYRPREDFKESDLPPVARQTIQYLRGEDKMCRASKTLTATERDKVVATYEKIRNADLKIPNIKQDDLLTFFELFGTLTVADDTIFDLEWRTPTGFRVKISNLVYERSNNPHDKLVIRLTFEDGKLWEVAWESE